MGGEGSLASAILSLKQNRALLKKRNVRELRDLLYEKSGKTKLEFKEVSSAELAKIKEEIRREAKISARNSVIFYLVAFTLATGILIYLTKLFFSSLPE